MEFNSDALVNVNRLLTCGAANCTLGAEACEDKRATETVIANWVPAPHAVLQCREEWEVQSVPAHDVPDSVRRKDAEAWPYAPSTRNIALPVVATVLGDVPLITGET